MDGMRNPVGDQPPEVYWRRRVTVIVGAVLLGVILWFLISATFAGGESDPAASPDVTVSPETTAAPGGGDPSRACTDADLNVTMEATPVTLPLGTMPAFEVKIKHTGDSPCTLSTTAPGTSFDIRSGQHPYYSSTWCTNDSSFGDKTWILQNGDRETLTVTWDGNRYNDQCEKIADATTGSYWAGVTIGDVSASEVQFHITG